MKDTELYTQILGISSPWYVASIEMKMEEESIFVHLAYDPLVTQWSCPECGSPCKTYDTRERRTWRHLDSCQLKTFITASSPRVSCKDHGVLTVRVPWSEPNSRFTIQFEQMAILMLRSTQVQSKAATLLRLSAGQVHDIMHRAVSRGLSRRDAGEGITHLSLDEKSFRKGHRYVSVLGDPNGKRVLDIIEKRTLEVAEKLLVESLTPSQRLKVKSVSMDMWPAYMQAVNTKLPSADIVHDRFHVIKYLNLAVDDTRRSESRRLAKSEDGTLKRSKYLWLRAPERMTEKQCKAFERLRNLDLDTAKAWAFKESFRRFFQCATVIEAQTFFYDWYEAALLLKNAHLSKVAQMLNRHIEGLLAYVRHKVTNASAEGLNSLIQQIKSNAKGFRRFDNFRVAVLFFLGKLDLSPQTSP